MGSWTNATPPATGTRSGILRPDEALRHFDRSILEPADDVSRWVEHYWSVRWSLPPGTTYRSVVLTHPSVHLTVESGTTPHYGFAMPAALVNGVVTRTFEIDLSGDGRAFGVRFRPGGFGAFTGRPVAELTDRAVPASDVLGPSDLLERVLPLDHDVDRARTMDAFLRERAPAPDPTYERLLDLVAVMLADRSLTTVEAVTERTGVSLRTLQRLFRRYVGVGPKWMLRRFRLHDAVSMIDAGDRRDLASLAHELGWYDQAHFTREFTDLIGVPPSEYAGRAPVSPGRGGAAGPRAG